MLLKCAAVALLVACATPVAGASVEWSGARHGATLPAQVSQNVMFAPLSVRGATLRFLVDTGASGTLQLEGGVATNRALHGAAGVRRDLGHGVGGDFGFVWLPVAAVRACVCVPTRKLPGSSRRISPDSPRSGRDRIFGP
jgi:hypothetical protein